MTLRVATTRDFYLLVHPTRVEKSSQRECNKSQSAEAPKIYTNGKNGFAEVSKNLARYKSEDNFVGPSK